VVLTPAILGKLRQVLREKLRFSDRALYKAETLLRRVSLPVFEPDVRVRVVGEDPDDDRILEAAIAGRADAIVSGDRHLLALRAFRGIPILTPRQLLNRLKERQGD
jgi:predicted nucleic acid-binding protein